MSGAQIEIAGTLIDLNETISYVFQVNDIAEISDRQATYTNSFKIPRTKDIVELFEGLGIAGDTSSAPYRKVSCRLFDNYVPVLEKGWLQVRHTDARYYYVAVYSGVIDFFKAIENKTTEDIDFSDLAHDKTVQTIIDTWNNDLPYRYFIADYGAGELRTYNPGTGDIIDAGSLQPSFKMAWLWDKIFDTYGFTYSGSIFQTNDFNSRYITYPKNRVNTVSEQAAHLRKFESATYEPGYGPMRQDLWRPFIAGNANNSYDFFQVEGSSPVQGTSDGWKVRITETGYYNFEVTVNCNLHFIFGGARQYNFFAETVTGGPFIIGQIDSDTVRTFTETRQFTAGDVIDFIFIPSGAAEDRYKYFTFNDFVVNIYKVVSEGVPVDALMKIGLTDFFKEVLWMFGLTAIQDKYSNNIEFLTLSERINGAETVNWSEKYVRRTKEEYVYGYAKENYLRHRYVEEGDDLYDGVIRVNNENLQERKTLITSNFYAPHKWSASIFPGPIVTKKYPFMTVTLENFQPIDEFEAERHFLITGTETAVNVTLGLRAVPGSEQEVTSVYEESFDAVSYETGVSKYYSELETILNDTRIHTIELCLSAPDAGELDFTKLYYFDQEANYYLLNKLQYEEGKFAQAEFVRVKLTRLAGEFSDAFSEGFNI